MTHPVVTLISRDRGAATDETTTPIVGARRRALAEQVAARATQGENDTTIAAALGIKPRQVTSIRNGFAIPAGQPRPSPDRLPLAAGQLRAEPAGRFLRVVAVDGFWAQVIRLDTGRRRDVLVERLVARTRIVKEPLDA